MDILFVLRMVILDIVIMFFLIFYNHYCNTVNKTKSIFGKLAVITLLYTVLGAITEITVNSDTVPAVINNVCHIFYYSLALIFAMMYFNYVLSLIISSRRIAKYIKYVYALVIICITVIVLAPIEYAQGEVTKYSKGIGAAICYTAVFVVFVVSDIVMFKNRKRIQKSILYSLFPISVLGVILLVVQVFVPEFLFSESVATLVSISIFFAVENPVGKIQDRAFVDMDTHTYNRNCYDFDLKKYQKKYDGNNSDNKIAFVMCDVNDLKYVNDTYGHLEGDKKIRTAAHVIIKYMKSASRIYRVGGDEFIAIYEGDNIKKVKEEVTQSREGCRKAGENLESPLRIAMGIAIMRDNETIEEVVVRADKKMYEDKKLEKSKI